jgi:hypothetical protein
MKWNIEGPAVKVAELLASNDDLVLPIEVMRIDEDSAVIVVDLDGIDYVLTMQVVPKQRERPIVN